MFYWKVFRGGLGMFWHSLVVTTHFDSGPLAACVANGGCHTWQEESSTAPSAGILQVLLEAGTRAGPQKNSAGFCCGCSCFVVHSHAFACTIVLGHDV